MLFSFFRFSWLYGFLVNFIDNGGYGLGLFNRLMLIFWLGFFLLQTPYVFGFDKLLWFIFFFVLTFFLSGFVCRYINNSFTFFFGSFIAYGSGWGSFIVLTFEMFSYLFRPLVLMARPLVNYGLGSILLTSLLWNHCSWNFIMLNSDTVISCFIDQMVFLLFIIFLLVYECCVYCVQWFIVMSFTIVESGSSFTKFG